MCALTHGHKDTYTRMRKATDMCAHIHTCTCHRHMCTRVHTCTHPQTYVNIHSTVPSSSYFVTLLAFSRGSCWPPSPRGCTFPWDTEGHLGESLANTGEAKQPRLRSLLKDRAMRALGGVLGRGRGQGQSVEASLVSPSEGPWRELDPQASRFCSEPEEPSKAILMGEGQTAMLGRLMKRLGEGKGFRGERQDGEKGLEGDGGTQVPVYTARWGLGVACWPGCREGERELRVS